MGTLGRFRDIVFWAENGVVYLEHTKRLEDPEAANLKGPEDIPKVRKGLPPGEFIRRALEAGRHAYIYLERYYSERKEILEFLRKAREVYREAMEQGAFDDPKANEHKLRHRVHRKTIVPVGSQLWLPQKTKTIESILLEGE